MRAFTTVLVALLAAGCSGGQGGDSVPRGSPSVTGTGYKIDKLTKPIITNPKYVPADVDLDVTGVSVLAVDDYDETKDGKSAGNIFVEDLVDPKATDNLSAGYHGVTVFGPSFNPPDLRVAPGDVVDMRGRIQAFTGPATFPFPAGQRLPEIVGGAISLRFEYNVPDPVTINVKDLADYQTGGKWIGMLVKVENVKIFTDGADDGKGRFSAKLDVGSGVQLGNVPTVTNSLFDLAGSGAPMTAGTVYKSIVGVVEYFQNLSIAPRTAQDLKQ